MSELLQAKFKDFVKLQRGFDLPKKNRSTGRYPVVASTSINGYHNEYKVSAPGVTTGRSGALGDVLYITTNFWPLNTALWVKDFKGNYPRYVYYFLKTLNLERYNSGAGVPTLNRNHLDNIDLKIHPLPTQKKIASILSAYDDLIENNTRRIKILEEMAQTIYREWFVKFRFPGHEKIKMVDSALGKIPEGWEVGRLGDLCQENRRTVSPTEIDDNTPYVGLAHIPRKSIGLTQWGMASEAGSTKYAFNKGEILFGKIRPYFHKVVIAPIDGVCSSDAIVISVEDNKWFPLVFMCVFSDEFVQHATQTSNGTKMPRANWKVLVEYPVFLPPEHVLNNFNSIVNNVVLQINNLIFKNTNLRQTRDLLLPKLISGEIDVSELAIETGAEEYFA